MTRAGDCTCDPEEVGPHGHFENCPKFVEPCQCDELRALVKRLRAWIDLDDVRIANLAANAPVWEELAEIDHEAHRLGCAEEE